MCNEFVHKRNYIFNISTLLLKNFLRQLQKDITDTEKEILEHPKASTETIQDVEKTFLGNIIALAYRNKNLYYIMKRVQKQIHGKYSVKIDKKHMIDRSKSFKTKTQFTIKCDNGPDLICSI